MGGSSPDSLTWNISGVAELSLAFPNSKCYKYLREELVMFELSGCRHSLTRDCRFLSGHP